MQRSKGGNVKSMSEIVSLQLCGTVGVLCHVVHGEKNCRIPARWKYEEK